MLLQNLTKLKKKCEIMLNTFSRSLIIWKLAIETRAQEMSGWPWNELGAWRAEQFPHLRNYTPVDKEVPVKFEKSSGSRVWIHIRKRDMDSRSEPDLPDGVRSASAHVFYVIMLLIVCTF